MTIRSRKRNIDWSSKKPSCTGYGVRHDWSVDMGTQGEGDANIFHDACSRCHAQRKRRRSYRAIADPHTATGDGRDWTLYKAAPDRAPKWR